MVLAKIALAPTDQAAGQDVGELFAGVGPSVLANSLPTIVDAIRGKQGKQVTLAVLAEAIAQEAEGNQGFRAELLSFNQQLLDNDASIYKAVSSVHESVVYFGDELRGLLGQVTGQQMVDGQRLLTIEQRLEALFAQMSDHSAVPQRIEQQNNVTGNQYIAERDQFNVNTTGDVTINTGGGDISHNRDAVLAQYRRQLIANHSTIRLFQFGSSAVTVGLEASYIQLQAARRSEDVDKLHADIDRQKLELEIKLRQRGLLTEREIQERLADYDFHYRAGLALDAEQKGLHEVVATYPRMVILGEPGAGKTTMLRHLAHIFAQDNPDLGLPQPIKPRLPLYIKLAEVKSYDSA